MPHDHPPQDTAPLWKSFVTIAQPYFFPAVPGGAWAVLVLVVMLLVFLSGLLALAVGGVTLAAHRLAPDLIGNIAPGLVPLVTGALDTHAWVLPIFLALPGAVFFLFRTPLASRKKAWILLGTVLLLSLSVTGINVAFSYIGNFFTTALVNKNQELAYLFVGVYFCGFLLGIPILALYTYVRDFLGMRWREWMTRAFLGSYFKNRRYYDIEARGEIDNPDQRIMEDIRSFTQTSLVFLLILLGSLMDLISFSGILWSKSRLLVLVVLAYSVLGTLITALMGRRLVRLNFHQLRYEADFRYSLVHVRDNTESIAFYQGEQPEIRQISRRFGRVLKNFSLLIGWQRNLSFFTTAYSYLPVVLPFVILFPQYFSGQIGYGDMVQANFAFTQVYAALSLIVSQIESITGFAAGIRRLAAFDRAISPGGPPAAGITTTEAPGFALDQVTLLPPQGDSPLTRQLSLSLGKGETLLVTGPSGAGKSSLLRAVAGLWTRGQGRISRPPLTEIFFMPQRPYMVLGSLRDQLLYPCLEKKIDDNRLNQILGIVRLGDLPGRVGGLDAVLDWADVLSLGEQQRLAFARLLVNRPAHAVLDEATSALDVDNEANLYGLLRQLGIQYISVGHRPSIIPFHDLVLELKPPEQWRLVAAGDYQNGTG